MNLFEIRKIENTDIFRTDLKLVFDVIRCSEDKGKLKALIGENPVYQHLKRDAYLLIDKYANVKDLIKIEEDEGDEVNMCKALEDMKEEYLETGREEGRKEGREEERLLIIRQMIKEDMDKALIRSITKCTEEEYMKASFI